MAQNGGGTGSSARKDGGELKIVIVGDGGCGKTSLLMVYAKGDFPEVRRASVKQLRGLALMNLFKILTGDDIQKYTHQISFSRVSKTEIRPVSV